MMRMLSLEPRQISADRMWSMMEQLYPVYRSLCGPGFKQSLGIVSDYLNLEISDVPSGTNVYDWTVPKEFRVNEAWVKNSKGEVVLDFEDCNYHVWVYSQPFDGKMSRDKLVSNISTHPCLDDAVPMNVTYYREKWGLSASKEFVNALPEDEYHVHIDCDHFDGSLQIGEYYIEGQVKDEILITSYLCHPSGANDNLSGVVLATELFNLLKDVERPHYSYRLAIWPENIGCKAYLYTNQERIKHTVGGYVVTCVGDSGPFTYKSSFYGDSMFDRAAKHALNVLGEEQRVIPYAHHGSDECHFNSIGLRLPFGSLMRTPYAEFPQYHSSADNLEYVTKEELLRSLRAYAYIIMCLERNQTYQGDYIVDPFLTGRGVYPFSHGIGEGQLGDDIGLAYYHLMGWIDGKHDMLSIAEKTGCPIHYFDEAVRDFLRVGLMHSVDQA